MARSENVGKSRQRATGEALRAETRRRLLRAAEDEFAERGYHAATVSRIAARAGVTVQTLYLAWGSKRALLRAHMEASLAGDPDVVYAQELPLVIDRALAGTGSDAGAKIEHIAHLHCQMARRAALGWKLYRDAAASDDEIAADWQVLQELRRETFGNLVGQIPVEALRAGLSQRSAVDTAWTIASPESYELLVRTANYGLDEYEQWVAHTLRAALLGALR